ncbi:FAD-binding and (Fe-S)-binding domain-containing protein [Psychroserpens sp. BH13MA-6]
MQNSLAIELLELQKKMSGALYYNDLIKSIYATDASVYRMMPLAVALPKNLEDIQLLMQFARENNTSIIPRAAGTSLAGQCVGNGIVVDVSKHFTKILKLDEKQKTVTVQPGVVRDALNHYLEPFGLFFGPNTSTSNRCMIGGMVGNNSSGTTSIQYGVTRDKVLALEVVLSDGSQVVFSDLSAEAFEEKLQLDTLEGHIYRTINDQLSRPENQQRITAEFPKPQIHRRNTGYAIDELLKAAVFSENGSPFNMCKLLAGSEGTLAFVTRVTLQLDDIPPANAVMIAAHFDSIDSCLDAVAYVMNHNLYACEMMDKSILDLTKYNKTQESNRSFIQGDPQAILMCELRSDDLSHLKLLKDALIEDLKALDLSYAYPTLEGNDIQKANDLRKAGLGLLGNMIGDEKTAACIEDTAVALEDLSSYIKSFSKLMEGYNQKPVYYAHAGAGELHLRPILNLKKTSDVKRFREITTDVARLVKTYQGSMSGEHGDGIVRAEFIPIMIGSENYQLLKHIKTAFDPDNILNPGKIVDAFPMDKSLRYEPDREEPQVDTIMDFSSSLGILREAEKCNGSGDCRKLPEFGGTMCPSFRATRDEKDSTRARANALREYLTHSEKRNKFDHEELKEVFDLCLSCKACASECPSSVDVASLKAEFQYQYQKANGISWRTKLFAYNNLFNRYGSHVSDLANFFLSNKWTSSILKLGFKIAPQRDLPLISSKSLNKVYKSTVKKGSKIDYIKEVFLFNDEFTNHLDVSIGTDALELLEALNYKVTLINHSESGRSFLSKGLLLRAKHLANQNVTSFKDLVSDARPLIGIEPSAILTFRDEYLRLADDKIAAKTIAKHTFLIEEFIEQEIMLGNITSDQFTSDAKRIKFHGHCHQKALANQASSFAVLNLPKNYKVTIIPSGCCGMAGSFGYEQEHYDISMAIGEQTLFPAVRKANDDVIISANGTSCRHQIKDGTKRDALHPVSILRQALL